MVSFSAIPQRVPPGTVSQALKRVRPYLAGQLVADSASPLYLWEHSYYPQYAFAPNSLTCDLVPAGEGPDSPAFGQSQAYDVIAGGARASKAALRYPQAPDPRIRNHTILRWDAMTTWLEEDEVVTVHARSPYVRIDALPSQRHVVVRAGGHQVADSRTPVILFETHLTPRYYLRRADVRMDLFVESQTLSHCPYKGTARYWSLRDPTMTDVLWGYDAPLPESAPVAGLVCFWAEKYDDLVITVDGEESMH